MKLDEGKLILTEEELNYVKRASIMQAGPTNAGLFLRSFVKKWEQNMKSVYICGTNVLAFPEKEVPRFCQRGFLFL